MKYKVTRQYARGADTLFAQFSELADATLFVEQKLIEDARLNVKVIYRIHEFTDVIKEYNPEDVNTGAISTGSNKGSTAAFSPTPFNTTARPPGTPPKWMTDEKDSKK